MFPTFPGYNDVYNDVLKLGILIITNHFFVAIIVALNITPLTHKYLVPPPCGTLTFEYFEILPPHPYQIAFYAPGSRVMAHLYIWQNISMEVYAAFRGCGSFAVCGFSWLWKCCGKRLFVAVEVLG